MGPIEREIYIYIGIWDLRVSSVWRYVIAWGSEASRICSLIWTRITPDWRRQGRRRVPDLDILELDCWYTDTTSWCDNTTLRIHWHPPTKSGKKEGFTLMLSLIGRGFLVSGGGVSISAPLSYRMLPCDVTRLHGCRLTVLLTFNFLRAFEVASTPWSTSIAHHLCYARLQQ